MDTDTDNNIDYVFLQKMKFIHNALESGWTIVKNEDKYIFNKKHENKEEIYLDSYLQQFIVDNMHGREKNVT
jgi:hypothetical protein